MTATATLRRSHDIDQELGELEAELNRAKKTWQFDAKKTWQFQNKRTWQFEAKRTWQRAA
jgi:hypothetical protein